MAIARPHIMVKPETFESSKTFKASKEGVDALFSDEYFLQRLEDFMVERRIAACTENQIRYKAIVPFRPTNEPLLIKRAEFTNILWQIQQRKEGGMKSFLEELGGL